MTEFIPGYRPGSESPSVRMSDIRHLMMPREAAQAHTELREAVSDAVDEGTSVPCVSNPEAYTSDVLPTDRVAQRMCALCPLAVFQKCEAYRQTARPAWGVHAGKVSGRSLAEVMDDE